MKGSTDELEKMRRENIKLREWLARVKKEKESIEQ